MWLAHSLNPQRYLGLELRELELGELEMGSLEVLWGVGCLGGLAIAGVAYGIWQIARVATAYQSKELASGFFLSGRSLEEVSETDLRTNALKPLEQWFLAQIQARVDPYTASVTAQFWGVIQRQAIYRPTLGCTVVLGPLVGPPGDLPGDLPGDPPVAVPRDLPVAVPRDPFRDRTAPADLWAATSALRQICDRLFEPAVLSELGPPPRAMVLLNQGEVVAEGYAPGFDRTMRLRGWSMTKGVIAALVGILVGQGKLTLDEQELRPEWCSPGDPRRQISVDHLLKMASGLDFREVYDSPWADVIQMLWTSPDTAAFAARKPLRHPPGQVWSYASGTTNILSRLIRDRLGDDLSYWQFPQRELFTPLGMTSAVLEVDTSGTFVGSSFLYATARDWARFGQLYVQDGCLPQGDRLLPADWVTYTRTPTVASSLGSGPDGGYGAHFYLQGMPSGPLEPNNDWTPLRLGEPAPILQLRGFMGQYLTMLPERGLVIVLLGQGCERKDWFLRQILALL